MARCMRYFLLATLTVVGVSGCSSDLPPLPDSSTHDGAGLDGAIVDGPTVVDCTDKSDGASCGDGLICVGGLCGTSRCGDGYVDAEAGEQCEDDNEIEGDGCTLCRWDCASNEDCQDSLVCNGEEVCDLDAHRCRPGALANDGDPCLQDSGSPGSCSRGVCVAPGCGNGLPDAGEDCDDQNDVSNDGCESDCRYSCTSDADCDDGDICTGVERCNQDDPERPFCEAGQARECPSLGTDCQSVCDPRTGDCVYPDGDQDGVTCDTDCDDKDNAVFPGAEECFDGKDNDCNPNTADGADGECKCYVDGDEDGYPPSGAQAVFGVVCEKGYTRTAPGAGTSDCHDGRPDVNPSQTGWFEKGYTAKLMQISFDYDCSGAEEKRYTTVFSKCTGGALLKCGGSGWDKAVPECGKSGDYISCLDLFGLCTAQRPIARVQSCH